AASSRHRRPAARPRAGPAGRSALFGRVLVVAVEAVVADQAVPLAAAKVDGAAAAQRRRAAEHDEGFVDPAVLQDLFRLDRGARGLRAVLRASGAAGGTHAARLIAFDVAGSGGDHGVVAAQGGALPPAPQVRWSLGSGDRGGRRSPD